MLKLGKDVKIHPTAEINVDNGYIGDRSVIRAHAVIEGRDIRIGHEAMICEYAVIGGGSRFDPTSYLTAGDFFHMGRFSLLNQGYGVKVGHEFGCGVESKVYTHGAYESVWDGFPAQWGSVEIGDRVWMPYAQINPGVKIGNDVVILAMSLVNKDLPGGCLAGGVPCKVIKEKMYPRELSAKEKAELFEKIFNSAFALFDYRKKQAAPKKPKFSRIDDDIFSVEKAVFDLKKRTITGTATPFSEALRDQLRRNGVRFRYKVEGDSYVPW
jgi:acetyltransferase-like isoleucine patch superfamily enzyme